jgi:hypothetical protein
MITHNTCALPRIQHNPAEWAGRPNSIPPASSRRQLLASDWCTGCLGWDASCVSSSYAKPEVEMPIPTGLSSGNTKRTLCVPLIGRDLRAPLRTTYHIPRTTYHIRVPHTTTYYVPCPTAYYVPYPTTYYVPCPTYHVPLAWVGQSPSYDCPS